MSEHTPLTEAEIALVPLLPMDPARSDVIAWAEAILAARTSTTTAECEDCTARDREFGNLRWLDGHAQGLKDAATADTGLRERVEALIEAGRDSLGGMPNLVWVSELIAALEGEADAQG